jgi:protein ImuB
VALISTSPRPLWLLDPPQALDIDRQQRPRLGALLLLEQGPERIETGWWDHADATRDYYVARHPDGERLWIFRQRDDQSQWFLHGLFG